MKTVIGAAAAHCLSVLGIAIAVLAMAGRLAGPYTLVLPADGDPASAARAGCHAAVPAVFITQTLPDGRLKVFYRCQAA